MTNDKRIITTRLLIACVVAMVVTSVCFNVTWGGAGNYIHYPQMFTRSTLRKMDKAVKTYYSKKGVLPQSLSQLKAVSQEVLPIQDEGVVWDAWRQPLVYEVRGDDYLILSYGRDGKPGGIGLDCDLSQKDPRPPEAELPFFQVIFHPLAQGMVMMSLLSGALTFVLTFSLVKPADFSRSGAFGLAGKLFVTLIATLFVATFITIMHVPSGH